MSEWPVALMWASSDGVASEQWEDSDSTVTEEGVRLRRSAITWKVHNNASKTAVYGWSCLDWRLNFEYLHDNKTADPNQSRVIDHTKTISLNLARVTIDIIHGVRERPSRT